MQRVEKFYGWGVENYGDFHGGYLNFGLWEEGSGDYLGAAENIVRRMGALLGLDGESRLLDVGRGMGAQDVYLQREFGPRSIKAYKMGLMEYVFVRAEKPAAGR